MPRLTKDQWETVRAGREAGASFPELADRFGVSHQAIQKRAKAEGWSDGSNVADVLRRKVAEKVAGVVAGCNPKKKAEALDAAAQIAADVVDRHRSDWAEHRVHFKTDEIAKDFEKGKSAKISSEMLAIRQKGERAAYGLDDATGSETIEIVRSYGAKA